MCANKIFMWLFLLGSHSSHNFTSCSETCAPLPTGRGSYVSPPDPHAPDSGLVTSSPCASAFPSLVKWGVKRAPCKGYEGA